MASLKAIRKRISTTKSTQKITRAMKMVAGARLARAQSRILALRPYALKTQEILAALAAPSPEQEASTRSRNSRTTRTSPPVLNKTWGCSSSPATAGSAARSTPTSTKPPSAPGASTSRRADRSRYSPSVAKGATF